MERRAVKEGVKSTPGKELFSGPNGSGAKKSAVKRGEMSLAKSELIKGLKRHYFREDEVPGLWATKKTVGLQESWGAKKGGGGADKGGKEMLGQVASKGENGLECPQIEGV